ncbi:MAG: type II secretion system minor pseudopilin GspK [Betaproteobacteria bacterium]
MMPRSMKQHGVAIITALLVVMLAASIAAFMLAQQSQALTRTERAAERAQATLYAAPTLDWARSALFQLQKSGPRVDLTQPWAQGLNAIPIDGAIASGALRDDGGLFNLNNLVKLGVKSEADVLLFTRLLKQLKLNPALAYAVVDWIDSDDETSGSGGAENSTYLSLPNPYRAANQNLVQLEELARVRGFDAATIIRLRPFVTALPLRTPVNINTAPQEVLTALFPTMAEDEITALVQRRQAKPFADKAAVKEFLKKIPPGTIDENIDTGSAFFSVYLAIGNGGSQVRQSALLQRAPTEGGAPGVVTKWPSIIWVKTD